MREAIDYANVYIHELHEKDEKDFKDNGAKGDNLDGARAAGDPPVDGARAAEDPPARASDEGEETDATELHSQAEPAATQVVDLPGESSPGHDAGEREGHRTPSPTEFEPDYDGDEATTKAPHHDEAANGIRANYDGDAPMIRRRITKDWNREPGVSEPVAASL